MTRHPNDRPTHADPQHDSASAPSALPGMFSQLNINIFSRQKKLTTCMSNCRSIEVVVLYPRIAITSESPPLNSQDAPSCPNIAESQNQDENECQDTEAEKKSRLEFTMSPIQEPTGDLICSPTSASHDTPSQQQGIFPFLALPLELRLKIYAYLLPPRTHVITTQIPHNGHFYNTSTIPLHAATSFYPFGRSAPSTTSISQPRANLTTYKILNRNFRTDFPEPSIYPHLLLVCKQVKAEAEPLLYAAPGVSWDFGISIEAVGPFFGDRSQVARECVRNLKVAREIRDGGIGEKEVDYSWNRFCGFVAEELVGLRTIDLTIWSSSGGVEGFPSIDGPGEKEVARRWREWEWIQELLGQERKARVTWWGFQGEGVMRGQGFDSWLARRMVMDHVVREKMVEEGVVREGVIVLH